MTKKITKTNKAKQASKKVAKSQKTEMTIGDEVQLFITHIESLSKALSHTMQAMNKILKKDLQTTKDFIDSKGIGKHVEKNKEVFFKLNIEHKNVFEKHIKSMRHSMLAVQDIPRIFLCSLVHHYDAYLGRLIRACFYQKPELLRISQKSMTYEELMNFKDLDDARETIIEKEVESVIRDSHSAHFDWMEKRFGLPLRENLSIWPTFIELTERRNLFVHCNGSVSSQYLQVCNKNGVIIEKGVKVGDTLHADEEYFNKAFNCIYEIGAKLGHVLWRKLIPEDIEAADHNLHLALFDLLAEEKYELVKKLLLFSLETLKKPSSDNLKRINTINLAIAYKFSGEKQKCIELLSKLDWTACNSGFSLAIAVLRDDYSLAAKIMRGIGKDGSPGRIEYATWPLFKQFRKTTEFLEAYKNLFGEDFLLPEDN